MTSRYNRKLAEVEVYKGTLPPNGTETAVSKPWNTTDISGWMIFVVRDWRAFSGIPGLYPLNADISPLSAMTTQNSSRH